MNRYLYNTVHDKCGSQLPNFVVGEHPIKLTVFGLLDGQTIPIETLMSGTCIVNGKACEVLDMWVPLNRDGCAAELSGAATQQIHHIPGAYRVDVSALPPDQPVAILAETMPNVGINYNYNMDPCACPCSPPMPITVELSDFNYIGGGQWLCDQDTGQQYWVEVSVDVDTGEKIYTYYTAPGGSVVSPPANAGPCGTCKPASTPLGVITDLSQLA